MTIEFYTLTLIRVINVGFRLFANYPTLIAIFIILLFIRILCYRNI